MTELFEIVVLNSVPLNSLLSLMANTVEPLSTSNLDGVPNLLKYVIAVCMKLHAENEINIMYFSECNKWTIANKGKLQYTVLQRWSRLTCSNNICEIPQLKKIYLNICGRIYLHHSHSSHLYVTPECALRHVQKSPCAVNRALGCYHPTRKEATIQLGTGHCCFWTGRCLGHSQGEKEGLRANCQG